MKKNYRKPRIKFIELGMEAALLAASNGTMPANNQNGISGNGASNSNNSVGWLAPTAHGIIDDCDTENE